MAKISSLTHSERSLVDAIPDGLVFVDEVGRVRDVNEAFVRLTDYTFSEIVGQPVELLVPREHQQQHRRERLGFFQNAVSRSMAASRDLMLVCKDGHRVPVGISLSPLEVRGEVWVVAAIRDHSVRNAVADAHLAAEEEATVIRGAAAELLLQSEERFRLTFEDNMAPMVISDHNQLITDVNKAYCHLVGFTKQELLGRTSQRFTHDDDFGVTEEGHLRLLSGEVDQVRYVKRFVRKDGRPVITEVSKAVARDASNQVRYFISSLRDITERQELTDQLSHQALHDSLTSLPNRALFDDQLARAHARMGRHGGLVAVLLLDLDDFKGVNDVYGHVVGDQLLIGVARRLELVTRSSDTLCRPGGDEFLYLAESLTSHAEAEQVADRLLNVLAEPFAFSGIVLEQHATIGIAICDGQASDHGQLIEEADVALYEAKRHNKGHHLIFAKKMRETAASRFSMAQELRQALNEGQISMYFQPIVNLRSTRVVGFEALMRWEHPERGWIQPDVFIPIAERSELILDLGSLAIRESLAAACSWKGGGAEMGEPIVSVNFSAHQFHRPDLMSIIETALSSSGLSPDRLIIEITESVALLDAAETMRKLSRLRQMGISIALDDFGTGFSSLSYLALLKPAIIKIDRSFVSPERESDDNDALLEAIASLGLRLDMTVLGEGIETREQLSRLRLLGCQLGQGYLFSPAVPVNDTFALLNHSYTEAN